MPQRSHLSGSTRHSMCDWPRILKMPTFSMPRTCCRIDLVFVASTSSMSRSGPTILTELSPLIPERASKTLSRMFCEKFQVMPGSFRSSSSFRAVDQLVFCPGSRGPKIHDFHPDTLTDRGQSFSGRKGTKYSLL